MVTVLKKKDTGQNCFTKEFSFKKDRGKSFLKDFIVSPPDLCV